jgi:hypothetical protein
MFPMVVVEVKVFPNEGVAEKARTVGVVKTQIAASRINEKTLMALVGSLVGVHQRLRLFFVMVVLAFFTLAVKFKVLDSKFGALQQFQFYCKFSRKK